MNRKGISAIVITYNEASSIDRCLSSLCDISDEIIVVDSFSDDSTEEICSRFNVKFVKHEFTGYMDQKNFASTLASYDYILSLDADEELSPLLKESIKSEKDNLQYDGYFFNRLSNFCGQWIRHSAWYPDRQLRLFRKDAGSWGKMNVHETFRMNPGRTTGRLDGDILHWPGSTEEEISLKVFHYSELAAAELSRSGKKASLFDAPVHFAWRLFLTYILHLGFLDGKNGWKVCLLGARSSMRKYLRLRELNKLRERI